MAILTYKSCWHSPGYRHLRPVLFDAATGAEHDLSLRPRDVQSLIFDCADAAKQIGAGPPIDWDVYPTPIVWPTIIPWQLGPTRLSAKFR